MGRITVSVDELLLQDVLACYVGEQDWGDYSSELDGLVKDIIEHNDGIKQWAKENKEENLDGKEG